MAGPKKEWRDFLSVYTCTDPGWFPDREVELSTIGLLTANPSSVLAASIAICLFG